MKRKKILIFTDTYEKKQLNGVVISVKKTAEELKRRGFKVKIIDPGEFKLKIPFPFYPEILITKTNQKKIEKIYNSFNPDYVHIATEGSIGLAAKKFLDKKRIPYTTAYHTDWPEYLKKYFAFLPIKNKIEKLTWSWINQHHEKAKKIYYSTKEIKKELVKAGIPENKLHLWIKGVNLNQFNKEKKWPKDIPKKLEHPIGIYVGRIAKEKNIEDFLKINDKTLPTKIVVGKGPLLEKLKKKYPKIIFVGEKKNKNIADYYAVADVFIHPPKTDTFGITVIEALASGLPIVAYPVKGPKNIIEGSGCGVLTNNLEKGIKPALKISKKKCREYSKKFTWKIATDQFLRGFT